MVTQEEDDIEEISHSFYNQYVVDPGTRRFDSFLKRIEQEAKEQVPQLSVPASEEECLAAAGELKKKCAKIWARHKAEKRTFEAWYNDAIKFHDHMVVKLSQDGPERALLTKGLEDMKAKWNDTKATLVQECLLSMVKPQNEKLKSWFWKDVLGIYRKKVSRVKSTRPDTKFRDTGARSSLQAPVEVMEMVFECADLETCVALRRVSKAWYACFNDIEEMLRDKLEIRNPWMKPGDVDLKRWADCVLVFVSRKLSKKWEQRTGPLPDSWNKTGKSGTTSSPVVGMEMDFGEPLPPDFLPLSDEQCRVVYNRPHLKGFWNPRTGSWNDKSFYENGDLQARWVHQETIKMVREDAIRRFGTDDDLEENVTENGE
ncbi:hypothetical protein CKK34_5131 [Yarrowia sp. E02]|nr:hypothetical protein CKK34_5131 [Yarrowia sp. E02]